MKGVKGKLYKLAKRLKLFIRGSLMSLISLYSSKISRL